jgi:hypothetical protein
MISNEIEIDRQKAAQTINRDRDKARVVELAEAVSSWWPKVLQSEQDSLMKKIFSAAQLKQINKWIVKQGDPALLDRYEAIRRLVELGLKAEGRSRRGTP